MAYYRVISYGKTKRNQKVIEAETLRAAKMRASQDFPTEGAWKQLDNSNSHVKTVNNSSPDNKLFLIPI